MTMTKKLVGVTFLGAILAGVGLAHAGVVSNQQVMIWSSGGLDAANGALLPSRNSSDGNQYIGCSRYAYDSGGSSIICYARDASGAYKSCSTGQDQMLRAAETLNPAGYLYFVVNPDGTCSSVVTVTASFFL
jgi:hypothetical protein